MSSYVIKLGTMFEICDHFVHVNKVNTISSFKPKLSNSKAEADFQSQITLRTWETKPLRPAGL